MYLGVGHAAYETQNSVLTETDPSPDYSKMNRNEKCYNYPYFDDF
jgi:hypothetical protein